MWSAARGFVVHLADPIDDFLTLCGTEIRRQAPEDIRARPELRCRRCTRLQKEAESA